MNNPCLSVSLMFVFLLSAAGCVAAEPVFRPQAIASLRAPQPPNLEASPQSWQAVPIEIGCPFPAGRREDADDLSARAWLCWNQEKLYLGVVVQDDQHVPGRRDVLWDGDAVQCHILTGDGQFLNILLLGLLEGGPQVIRWQPVGGLDRGEIPSRDADIHIRRGEGVTEYVLALPWSQLPGGKPHAGETFGFCLGVIDADQAGDAAQDTAARDLSMIQWTPAIFGGRDNDKLGTVTLLASDQKDAILEACSNWAGLSHPPALTAAGQNISLDMTIPALLVGQVDRWETAVLDSTGQPLATLTWAPKANQTRAERGSSHQTSWNTADLPDGTYTLRTKFHADLKKRWFDRTVTIDTTLVTEIENILAEAEQAGRAHAEELPFEARRGLRTCIAQARSSLRRGMAVQARDLAEQARVWADKTDLQLALPPEPLLPTPGPALGPDGFREGNVTIESSADAWLLKVTDGMEIRLDKQTLAIAVRHGKVAWKTIDDKPAEATFRMGDPKTTLPLSKARQREARIVRGKDRIGLSLLVGDWPELPGASVRLDVTIDTARGEALLAVVPQDVQPNGPWLVQINWPRPMRLKADEDGYWVFHSRSGCIVPADWPYPIDLLYPACGYSIGHPYPTLVRDGKGLLQFVESPHDAQIRIRNLPGEYVESALLWLPSWGRMRYPRQLRLAMLEPGSYVAAAQWYRDLLIERGKFVTLKQKIARQPAMAALHGGLAVRAPAYRPHKDGRQQPLNTFEQMARAVEQYVAWGFDRGALELTYWHEVDTFWTPRMSPWKPAGGWEGFAQLKQACHDNGWVFGFYDCYTTLYEAFGGYSEERALKDPQGLAPKVEHYSFGPNAWLAPGWYLPMLKTSMAALRAHDCVPDIFYLDTFIGRPDEDYDPRHPATRYQAGREKIACARFVRSQGAVAKVECEGYIGLEEVAFPYWSPPPDVHGFGVPVPLNHLVLHDSMYFCCHLRDFMRWTRGRGKYMQGKGAFVRGCLLGEVPMLYLAEMDIPRQYTLGAKIMANLHRRIGLRQMTDHRFLSDDYAIQETEFEGGVRIRANFRDMTVTIKGLEGFDETPIEAISLAYDFDSRAEIKKIGPRAFSLQLTLTTKYPPARALLFTLAPRSGGRRVGETRYEFVAQPEDWKNHRLVFPTFEFHLPPSIRDHNIEIALRAFPPDDLNHMIYMEGSVIGSASVQLGTVRVSPRRNSPEANFTWYAPPSLPEPYWLNSSGPLQE